MAGCIPLLLSWIYHRFLRFCPNTLAQTTWPLASRLIGYQQPDRDRQEGRLLRLREALDRSDIDRFRWTPYDTHELQVIVPDWIRSHLEIYTWRSAVPVVCFNMVHMHHVDRVLRQYGGEQPVPMAPVDLTRLMTSTGRGEDRWWPDTLNRWYDGWRGRGNREMTLDVCSPDLSVTTTHPRDDLVMPEDAPGHRRRAEAMGTGRRPPANADPQRPPANARDRRRRERIGVRVGRDPAQEEADKIARMRMRAMQETRHTFLRPGHSGLIGALSVAEM
ncbi:hypothetical protein PIB30_046176 [Stylosanthes scabra]|uniref:Aminotransferase-like plant mobile domain-containing protein n=1 Tax=Stylosanthes scabra TaxID=79078 RepID=A0ABU6WEG2_9FABA|nr:hypothetical protein [Stylosanthes scabra]